MNAGRLILFTGLIICAIGLVIMAVSKFNIPLGRLPGDIIIQKKNFSIYIPVTTCILISIILSLLFWIFVKK